MNDIRSISSGEGRQVKSDRSPSESKVTHQEKEKFEERLKSEDKKEQPFDLLEWRELFQGLTPGDQILKGLKSPTKGAESTLSGAEKINSLVETVAEQVNQVSGNELRIAFKPSVLLATEVILRHDLHGLSVQFVTAAQSSERLLRENMKELTDKLVARLARDDIQVKVTRRDQSTQAFLHSSPTRKDLS